MGSFKDNPGKRLLSIEFGAFVGLIMAAIVGLDLVSAILGTPTGAAANRPQSVTATAVGTLLTGVIMGLGATPTHEAIKLLQQYKERNKQAAAPTGGTAEGTNQLAAAVAFPEYNVLGFSAGSAPVNDAPQPYLVRFG